MSILTDLLQYSGNFENNYKDVTRRMGCEVSRPMTNPQPTEEGIFDKLDKAVGKALKTHKHEILQICQETRYSLPEVIELSLKNGLDITAKSVNPGRRFQILNEEEVEQ